MEKLQRAVGQTRPPRLNYLWLVRLRWVAVSAQALLVAWSVFLIELPLPTPEIIVLLALSALCNGVATVLHRRAHPFTQTSGALVAVILIDLFFLTGLLSLTGGPYNPFSFVYLTHVAVAAVTLPLLWTWLITALSLGMMGGLFLLVDGHAHGMMGAGDIVHGATHIGALTGVHSARMMQLHVEGMWLACAIAAALLVFFSKQLQRGFADQAEALRSAEQRRLEAERFSTLVSLAAGAAHELATPLASVSVACEQARLLLGEAQPVEGESKEALKGVAESLEVIHEEGARAARTLERLRASFQEGAPLLKLELTELVEDSAALAGEELAGLAPPTLTWPEEATRYLVEGPIGGLQSALKGLIQNGAQAQLERWGAEGLRRPIELELSLQPLVSSETHPRQRSSTWVQIDILDAGRGLSAAEQERIGTPFFSTRERGEGTGLGVFLASQVITSVGGSLSYLNRDGEGTCARVILPVKLQ